MLLTIDIGNTDIVFAIYHKEKWILQWRGRSNPAYLPETLGLLIRNHLLEADIKTTQISMTMISSVVPSLTPVVQEACELVFSHLNQIHILGPHLYDQLPVITNNPNELGTDLMANAVAAYHNFRQDCVVVDFGTALTFTIINAEGTIAGVAIAPGLRTAMKSLSVHTAQLPEIELELPRSVLGKHTTHAMQAGILYGYTGLVEKLLDTIAKEVGNPVKVVATGGLSSVLPELHNRFDKLDKMLTLEGLRIIAEIIGK